MNVLVINCGSSSIKYSLVRTGDGGGDETLASGLVEKIGEASSLLHHTVAGRKESREVQTPDHRAAFDLMLRELAEGPRAVLAAAADIQAVGHRVVHGGERFTESVRINDEVIAAVEAYASLAPLHNPPNLVGIRAAIERVPGAVHVAVFDTAFHQTLPPRAFLYAIPYDLYEQHDIRRYGFHGTSHRYVAGVAAELLRKPTAETNLITCHLGNGCSVAAVRAGKSVDTSMGLTPLEGLVMGTRSGDVDPGVVFHLMRALGMDADRIDALLNRESGLLGLSGVSNDLRDVRRAAQSGNRRADLALDLFCYRLKKYIGAYTAVLGRVDALVFTAGIGENGPGIRERSCAGLEALGYRLDPTKNVAKASGLRDIAARDSEKRIFVIPTDEEAMIARDTARIAAEE